MKIKIIYLILISGLLFLTQSAYAQCDHSTGHKSKTEKCCDESKGDKCCLHSSSNSSEMNSDSIKTTTVSDMKKCPVSGEMIEDAGVEYTYLGTVYTFCCKNCITKFKKEPMDYIQGELICPVGGETASRDVSTVVDGVKYYFCCQGCVGKFEADPQKYLNKDSK